MSGDALLILMGIIGGIFLIVVMSRAEPYIQRWDEQNKRNKD
jgi:hypothetical protein